MKNLGIVRSGWQSQRSLRLAGLRQGLPIELGTRHKQSGQKGARQTCLCPLWPGFLLPRKSLIHFLKPWFQMSCSRRQQIALVSFFLQTWTWAKPIISFKEEHVHQIFPCWFLVTFPLLMVLTSLRPCWVLPTGHTACCSWPPQGVTTARRGHIFTLTVQFNVLFFPPFKREERIKLNYKFRKNTVYSNF